MLILPPERSLTRSANLAAASPHGPVGPTTRLVLYSGLYVAAMAGPANPTATASTTTSTSTRLMFPPPWRSSPGSASPGIASRLLSQHLPDGCHDVCHLGKDVLLQRRAEGDRDISRRHPAHRRIQMVEDLLGDPGCHLGAKGARLRRLFHDHDPVRFLDRGKDRLFVEGCQASRIHHLCRNSVLALPVRRLQGLVNHPAGSDDCHIRATALDICLAERNEALFLRDLSGHLVQALVLEEQDGVQAPDACLQQALGVGWGGREDDTDAGCVDEPCLQRLRVMGG